jgi:hypothetical protein
MSREEMDMLQRRAERDRRAREHAERLLEEKSRDLYDTNERLRLATRGRLESLGRVGEDLSQLQDLDLLMSRILSEARTLTSADASSISPELTKQIIAACHQSSYTDVKTLADAFEAVDQGEFVIREGTDKKTGAKYLSVDYGAGDNTYGAIFKTGSAKPVIGIHDGDFEKL